MSHSVHCVSEDIRYARSNDGTHIAYRVRGDGPLDILEVGGFGTLFPLDAADEQPRWRRFEQRLESMARLIKLDLRGVGYSDPLVGTPTVDDWVADAIAVLDAVGAERVNLLASSFGGFAAIQLAAQHPERVAKLVLANTAAKFLQAEDYPAGAALETGDQMQQVADPNGANTESNDIDVMAPSIAADTDIRRWWTKTARRGAGPATAAAMWDIALRADVRQMVHAIHASTLVIHTLHNEFVPPPTGSWLADHIPDSSLLQIPAADHVIWAVPDDAVVNEIERFLTGNVTSGSGARSMKALLFTDIVESTAQNATRGDGEWLELVARHDAMTEQEIHRYGGTLIKRLGDGLLATFPLASDSIRAAHAINTGATELSIEVRAGIHIAEIEELPDDVLGLGVNVTARVLGQASGGEVLVTNAIAELLAGSSLRFQPRGLHSLKGIDGQWKLHSATLP
jgi:pimeloyl-ACP methyl ester carboxylesterase